MYWDRVIRYVLNHSCSNHLFSLYSSGFTYAGYDVFSGEKVALKLEPRSSSFFHLENESTIYRYLGPKCTGIPQLKWSGIDHDHSVVVLSLLGPSLESLFSHNRHCFTLRVVATIAEQLVCLFLSVSSCPNILNYLHTTTRFLALRRSTHVILFTETWSPTISWLDLTRTSIASTSSILALRSNTEIRRHTYISPAETAIL